jgi:hypothetical protein
MSKDKFAILNEAGSKEIQKDAPLKESANSNDTFQMSVYGMNRELADKIKATGESTSNFAKRAIRKLAREEGII